MGVKLFLETLLIVWGMVSVEGQFHEEAKRAPACDWPRGFCVYRPDPCPANMLTCSLECTQPESHKCCCYGCPDGWEQFESSCYLFSDTREYWDSADAQCLRRGASLVSIKSQIEQEFVEYYFKGRSWLGMTDKESEGNWVWLEDGSEVTYTNWDAGEPNGGTRENFGMLWESGLWNDCQPGNPYCDKLYYICKKSR